MNETIFLLDNDGRLVELNESGYLTEDLLQKLLADYPALISGSQINPLNPRRWMLISREFGVPDDKDTGQYYMVWRGQARLNGANQQNKRTGFISLLFCSLD